MINRETVFLLGERGLNMETNLIFGFGFVLLGAIGGGSYALPSKFAKKMPWEVVWGLFFLFVTLLIPIFFAMFLVKDVVATWQTAGIKVVILPVMFGFLWGLGSMALGIGFSMIGLSLAYAINFGLQTGAGSLLPMALLHPEHIKTPTGMVIIFGIAVCVMGVVMCGYAGILKDRNINNALDLSKSNPKSLMRKGIIITVISGLICPCANLAFSYGADIITISNKQYENPVWAATLSVWILIFWGGCVSACGYCVYLLFKNKTWSSFKRPGIVMVLIIAIIMAIMHNGCLVAYGFGTQYLGVLGTSIGYAVFLSGIIIVGNIHGFITSEWKGAGKSARYWIMIGILIIAIGMFILGKGNSMLTSS